MPQHMQTAARVHCKSHSSENAQGSYDSTCMQCCAREHVVPMTSKNSAGEVPSASGAAIDYSSCTGRVRASEQQKDSITDVSSRAVEHWHKHAGRHPDRGCKYCPPGRRGCQLRQSLTKQCLCSEDLPHLAGPTDVAVESMRSFVGKL